MFSPANAHTLHPNGMETLCLSSRSLPLESHCQHLRALVTPVKVARIRPTGCSIVRPRLPEDKDFRDQAIAMPSSKTTHERYSNASSNGGNSTSSDVLCLMDSLGFTVTPDIYASLIDECTHKGDAYRASELWAHMERNKPMMRFLSKPKGLLLLKRILIMFMGCGSVDAAYQLFDKMPMRDSVVWCLMIAGLVDNSLYCEALDLFSQMILHPLNNQNDAVLQTLIPCVLKACVGDTNKEMGRTIHGWAIKLGYISNMYVGTAFLDLYGKFRCPLETNLLFYVQTQEGSHGAGDTVLWTGVLTSNCRDYRFEDTIRMFRDMGRAGIRKNEFTLSSVLKACARVQDGGSCGQQAHAEAIKIGLVDSHVFVQCSLVDMYSKCGKLVDARKVFDTISCKTRNQSTPCWNAMINGYLDNRLYVEAIKILYQMKAAGVEPQESLLQRVRIACGTRSLER